MPRTIRCTGGATADTLPVAPSTSHSDSALSIPLHHPSIILLAFLVKFSSQLSYARLCLPGFVCSRCSCAIAVPALSLFLRSRCSCALAVPALSLFLRSRCSCAIAVPALSLFLRSRCSCALATCPNHLTFLSIMVSLLDL